LEPDEARALVRQPNPKCRTGARDRAILAVLWRCGLRNGEVRNLDIDHLSKSDQSLRVMRPKGYRKGKGPRAVGVDDQTWELIDHWLTFRPPGPGPLFPTFSGQRILGRDLRTMIARKARDAGIERRVHPHCLRHTYARALYDEGVGIVHIQMALGHTALATTAHYLESIGASEVVAITSKRTWKL
tara:strand:+ start:114 stop:671 length:558 start_codon:yes stop_codon:yes gene_type:complete